MALFRKLVEGELLPDLELDAARKDARKGRLETGRTLLANCRDDVELREYRVRRLSTATTGRLDALAKLAEEHAEDPDLALWLGSTRIEHAWGIRGAATAQYVRNSTFQDFWAALAGAAEPLLRAAELLPGDPTPWDRLQWHGLGMQRPRPDLDDIWTELVARGPRSYAGHSTRAQVLCAKWQGSTEDVLSFAREAAATAGPGDPITALPIVAHFENAAEDGELGSRFRATEVRAEIERLSETFRATAPGDGWPAIEACHLFGFAFYLAGDYRRVRHHLSQVDPRRIPRTIPWARFPEPHKIYAQARKAAGL